MIESLSAIRRAGRPCAEAAAVNSLYWGELNDRALKNMSNSDLRRGNAGNVTFTAMGDPIETLTVRQITSRQNQGERRFSTSTSQT
jgi:hypothetical protein